MLTSGRFLAPVIRKSRRAMLAIQGLIEAARQPAAVTQRRPENPPGPDRARLARASGADAPIPARQRCLLHAVGPDAAARLRRAEAALRRLQGRRARRPLCGPQRHQHQWRWPTTATTAGAAAAAKRLQLGLELLHGRAAAAGRRACAAAGRGRAVRRRIRGDATRGGHGAAGD